MIGGILYAGRTSFSPGIAALGLQAFRPHSWAASTASVAPRRRVVVAGTVATSLWGPATQDAVAFGILLLIFSFGLYGLFGAEGCRPSRPACCIDERTMADSKQRHAAKRFA